MSTTSNYLTEAVQAITGKKAKAVEADFLGTGWCWFETYDGKAYWLHVPSQMLVESARNYVNLRVREYPLQSNQCNCVDGSWHAIGSQNCTMEVGSQ